MHSKQERDIVSFNTNRISNKKGGFSRIALLSLVVVVLLLSVSYLIYAFGILTPVQDELWVANSTPTFYYNFTGSDMMNCTLFIDTNMSGTSLNVSNDTALYIISNKSLADGNYSWYVNCTNTTESNVTGTFDVIIDTVAPIVYINMSLNDSDTNNNRTRVDFNFSDELSPNATCVLYFNDVARNSSTVDNGTHVTKISDIELADGEYEVHVNCTDLATNVNVSDSVNITVDTQLPTINIGNISFNTSVNTTSIIFNFTDSQSDTANCSLLFDGVEVDNDDAVINNSKTSLVSGEQADGSYTITINCTDTVDHEASSSSITGKIDSTAPIISISSPSDGDWTSHNTTNVTFTYTDAGSPWANCSVWLNGTSYGVNEITLNATPTTITTTEISDDTGYALSIICIDDVGNSNNTENQSLNVDANVPVVTMGNVSVNTTDNFPSFNFSFADSTTINASCVLYIGANDYAGTVAAPNNPTTLTANFSVSDGTYNVNVTCTDLANNSAGSTPIMVRIDDTPPTVNMLNTSVNTTDSTPNYIFNFSDNGSPVANCVLYSDDAVKDTNASTLNWTDTTLVSGGEADGVHTVYVNCTDDLGNIGKSSEITVKVDNGAPYVGITSPSPGAWTNDNTTAITFIFVDPLSPKANCTVFVNGNASGTNAITLNSSATIVNISSALVDGTGYNLTVNCTDDVGNSNGTSAQTLNIDTIPPTVNPVMPPNDNSTGNQTPTFVYNFTDALSPNATCTLYVGASMYNTTVVNNNSASTVVANHSIFQGKYLWNVTCVDLANNGGASTPRNLTVDTSAPNVNILNVSVNTTDTTPNIVFNYSDEGAATANCTLYFNNVSAGINGTTINATDTNITSSVQSDGIYSVQVNCTDTLGNVGESSEITVTIDSTGPTVTITSPDDDARLYENATNVTFRFTDAASPNASCELYINGTGYGINNGVLNNTLTIITINESLNESDDYEIVVNCTDQLGNLGTSGTQVLNIDRTAPSISAISTSGTASTTTTGTATVTATLSQNGTCWYDNHNFTAENTTPATVMTGAGTTSHRFNIAYSADGTLGPYYISCRDLAGNNMTTSNSTGGIAVTVTEATNNNGGGGGGGSSTNPTTSQTWDHVSAGVASIMKIKNDDFGIKEIHIELDKESSNVKIQVIKHSGQPATVSKEFTGNVYRYLELKNYNFADADIKGNVMIKFQVTRGWLLNNKMDPEDVVLLRFNNDAWVELKTKLLSTDDKYAYYEGETPGFSYFIIGEKGAIEDEPVVAETVVQDDTTTPVAEATTDDKVVVVEPASESEDSEPASEMQEPEPEEGISTLAIVLVILAVVLLVIILILTFVGRKRKKEKLVAEFDREHGLEHEDEHKHHHKHHK